MILAILYLKILFLIASRIKCQLSFDVLDGDNQILDLADRGSDLAIYGLSKETRIMISKNPLIKASVGTIEIRSDKKNNCDIHMLKSRLSINTTYH